MKKTVKTESAWKSTMKSWANFNMKYQRLLGWIIIIVSFFILRTEIAAGNILGAWIGFVVLLVVGILVLVAYKKKRALLIKTGTIDKNSE